MKTKSKSIAVLSTLFLLASCNQEEAGFKKFATATIGAPTEVINSACKTGEVCDNGETKLVVDPANSNTPGCKAGDPCDLTPQVSKPGVVTILLALGDIAQDKLVISEASALLIAQNAVKFASHISKPKILVVKDYFHNGESDGDTEFIAEKLLANYDAKILYETSAGLSASDLVGYDVVWFNNPGHPMGNVKSLETLKAFSGGVILSGDDLASGRGFTTQSLTGLKYIDNGTSLSCDGKNFNYDNNSAYTYTIKLEDKFLVNVNSAILNFEYGNDIDNTVLAADDSKYEVLAYAGGAAGTCNIKRPVIVRYVK